MRRFLLAAVVIVALGAVGCSTIKSALGLSTDPTTGEVKSDGTGGVAGSVLNYLIPGAGALLAAVAGAYARRENAKRKESDKAAAVTYKAIEDYEDPDLKVELAEAHKAAGVQSIVEKVLVKEGINTA